MPSTTTSPKNATNTNTIIETITMNADTCSFVFDSKAITSWINRKRTNIATSTNNEAVKRLKRFQYICPYTISASLPP